MNVFSKWFTEGKVHRVVCSVDRNEMCSVNSLNFGE